MNSHAKNVSKDVIVIQVKIVKYFFLLLYEKKKRLNYYYGNA